METKKIRVGVNGYQEAVAFENRYLVQKNHEFFILIDYVGVYFPICYVAKSACVIFHCLDSLEKEVLTQDRGILLPTKRGRVWGHRRSSQENSLGLYPKQGL